MAFYQLLPINVNILLLLLSLYVTVQKNFFKQYYVKSFKNSLITKATVCIFTFLSGISTIDSL